MRAARVAPFALAAALTACTHQLDRAAPSSTAATATASTTAATSPSATVTSSAPATPSPTPPSTSYAGTPGRTIAADMITAVAAATSVHYFGSLDQGGTPVDVDMKVTRSSATGTVDFSVGRVALTKVAGVVYVRAGAPVWRAQGVTDSRALTAIAGKWVRLPAADAARFRVFTDIGYLVAGFKEPSYVVAGERVVAGVPAVDLRDAAGTVLTVSSVVPHVPLAVSGAAGKGTLTFTRWNAKVDVRPPAHPVDLAALAAG